MLTDQEIDEWADELVEAHGLSGQLTVIWLLEQKFDRKRRLKRAEVASLKQYAKVYAL